MTTTFTCPTSGGTVVVRDGGFVSSHRTSTGRVGYLRCACDGLAVLVTTDGRTWRPVSHAAGTLTADDLEPVTAQRCA